VIRGLGRGRGSRGGRTAAAVALAVLALAGCGIRPTQVPVDAGPAPSRMVCELSGELPGSGPDSLELEVELVCSSQLLSVERAVELPSAGGAPDALRVARALLRELQREPSAAEREAGFTTEVPEAMTVERPLPGDPGGTLRLSLQPEDVPPTALAQVVCTLVANRTVSPDGTVVLGGPGGYPPREYLCPREVRDRPADPVPTRGPVA
jgi:hypothetical protein